MKFLVFTSLLLFTVPALASTESTIKKLEQCIEMAEEIGSELKNIAVIAKSTKAGSIDERKIFLKKLKPPIRSIKKNLRKSGRKMRRIDKSLDALSDEANETWAKSQQKLLRIDKYFMDAVERLPKKKDKIFLKPLNAAMKNLMNVSRELTFFVGLLKNLHSQLKVSSS